MAMDICMDAKTNELLLELVSIRVYNRFWDLGHF